jgi:hypothetical protein
MPDLEALIQMVTTGGAIVVLIWLVRLLLNNDLVTRERLEDQKALTAEALAGWKLADDANSRLADAWEARNAAEVRLIEARPK